MSSLWRSASVGIFSALLQTDNVHFQLSLSPFGIIADSLNRSERRFKLTIQVKSQQFYSEFSPLNEFRAIECGNSLISGR